MSTAPFDLSDFIAMNNSLIAEVKEIFGTTDLDGRRDPVILRPVRRCLLVRTIFANVEAITYELKQLAIRMPPKKEGNRSRG